MKQFKNRIFPCLVLAMFLCTALMSFKSGKGEQFSATSYGSIDSSFFQPNANEGWGAYSSYLHHSSDSINFELILFRTVPPNTVWSQYSEIGTINEGFRPVTERIFEYAEFPRIWRVRILANGKCYLQLISGSVPEGEPVVLPILTKFKN